MRVSIYPTAVPVLLGILSLVLLTAAPRANASDDNDGEGDEEDQSAAEEDAEDEANSEESRRSPALPPPIWKNSEASPPRPRGLSGPSLFPSRLGPIPKQAPPAPMASLSAQTCNACHGEIHDQWATSGHSRSATNPVYLAATRAMGNPPECLNCHLPLENQRPTLHFGPGSSGPSSSNPAYSPTLAQEGVTCAACHVRDGIIYGPRQLHPSEAPHPVAEAAMLRDSTACSFCHQISLQGAEEHPFMDTVGEWLRSPWGEAGIPCQQCHMPRTSGIIAGSRYAAFSSHEFLSNRDPKAMRRAVTLEIDLRKHKIERGSRLRASATLMNTGAGHAVPTGDPSHQLELRFEVLDANGEPAVNSKAKSHWLIREVETEPPFAQKSDSRLGAASSRVFDYASDISRKNRAGHYTLRVSLHWWAIAPDRAESIGLNQSEVRIKILEQLIPFSVF